MNINLTLFMQAVAFAAFIWFTAKFVWPPLMRAIDDAAEADRRRPRRRRAGAAEPRQRREAHRRHDGRGEEPQLAEIIAQGEKFKSETVEQAKAEAKAEADRILVAAKAEIEQEIARAQGSSCATRSPTSPSPARRRS